jgi:hypothetical protein
MHSSWVTVQILNRKCFWWLNLAETSMTWDVQLQYTCYSKVQSISLLHVNVSYKALRTLWFSEFYLMSPFEFPSTLYFMIYKAFSLHLLWGHIRHFFISSQCIVSEPVVIILCICFQIFKQISIILLKTRRAWEHACCTWHSDWGKRSVLWYVVKKVWIGRYIVAYQLAPSPSILPLS